jgi:hypothetical protein
MLTTAIVQDAIALCALAGLIWYVCVLRRQNQHTEKLVEHARTQALQATAQVKHLADESQQATRARLATVYQNVSMQMHDINRLFVEHSHLKRYFYEGVSPDQSDDDYAQVACIAEMFVDFMDNFVTQAPLLMEDYLQEGWQGYFRWIYLNSPIIRAYWDRHGDWYGDDLHELFADAARAAAD